MSGEPMDVLPEDQSWELLSSRTLGRLEAQRAQRLPWAAGLKPRYVRVHPSEISGRRFRFGPAAATY